MVVPGSHKSNLVRLSESYTYGPCPYPPQAIYAANPHARQLTRWVSQAHPAIIGGTHENEVMSADGSGELVAEAIEVHLNAGDALVFVDCMLHGSARRVNPGERRIFIARCESTNRNSFAMVWQRSLAHLLRHSEEYPCVFLSLVRRPGRLS